MMTDDFFLSASASWLETSVRRDERPLGGQAVALAVPKVMVWDSFGRSR